MVAVSATDTHHFIQELNRSAVAGKKDRKAREEAEKKMGQLAEQVDNMKREVSVAKEEAERAQKSASDAQATAARKSQQSQVQAAEMMRALMSGGKFGGCPGDRGYPMVGGGYSGRSGGRNGGRGNLRFYKGGQFIPGGGRAPRGGVYMRSKK